MLTRHIHHSNSSSLNDKDWPFLGEYYFQIKRLVHVSDFPQYLMTFHPTDFFSNCQPVKTDHSQQQNGFITVYSLKAPVRTAGWDLSFHLSFVNCQYINTKKFIFVIKQSDTVSLSEIYDV